MMKEALPSLEEEVKVEGVLFKVVRFADDQALVAGTVKEVQNIMEKQKKWLRFSK